MKRETFLFTLLLLFVSALAHGNPVQNPSMEGSFVSQDPLGSVAEAWTGYGSGAFSSGTTAHHGAKSQQTSWSGEGHGELGPDGIYQQIDSLESGRIYKASVWFRFDFQPHGDWGAGAITCRLGTDPNGGTIPDVVADWVSNSDGGSSTWKEIVAFFASNGEAATLFIEVAGYGDAQTEVWIDPWFSAPGSVIRRLI